MDPAVIIGSIGVTMLLAAFFFNMFEILDQETKTYAILNIVGAGMSCYSSILIGFWPFIILEGTWALVAFAGLVTYIIKNRNLTRKGSDN